MKALWTGNSDGQEERGRRSRRSLFVLFKLSGSRLFPRRRAICTFLSKHDALETKAVVEELRGTRWAVREKRY